MSSASAEGGPVLATRSLLRLLLLSCTIGALALGLRVCLVDRTAGRSLSYSDAIEYAATAQALALEGRYVLHLGEHTVQPPHPAGFPLLLSALARLGVGTEDLVYVNAVVGALSAMLLACIAFSLARALLVRGRDGPPLLAALVAGTAWALSPLSIDEGRQVMGDETAAFLATAATALIVAGVVGRGRRWVLGLSLFAGGSLAGASAVVRVLNTYFLPAMLLALFLADWRRSGRRRAGARLAIVLCGALLPVAANCWVMYRSGWHPFQWHTYFFWRAMESTELDPFFSLRYAFEGYPVRPWIVGGRRIGHLELTLRHFLGGISGGAPGDSECSAGLGLYWPAFGWLGAGWAFARLWRGRSLPRSSTLLLAIGASIWLGGHFAVTTLTHDVEQRFFIAPLLWCPVFAGLLIARLAMARAKLARGLGLALPAAILALSGHGLAPELGAPGPRHHPDNDEVRRLFADWKTWDDARRAEEFLPFDPERAQALGLFDPELLASIGTWGKLPPTRRRPILIARGMLPELAQAPAARLAPNAASLFPRGARTPGVPRVRFDPASDSYRLGLEDLTGRKLVEYRVPLAPAARGGRLRIEEATTGAVPIRAGWLPQPQRLVAHRAHRYRLSVALEFEDGTVLELRPVGRSLEIRATASTPDSAGFRFGAGEGPGPARVVALPHLEFPVFRAARGVYVSRFFDWYRSTAPRQIEEPSVAEASSFRGEVRPQHLAGHGPPSRTEVAYVTVSRTIEDCIPVCDRAPSPHRLRYHRAGIAEAAESERARDWLARAARLGMHDLLPPLRTERSLVLVEPAATPPTSIADRISPPLDPEQLVPRVLGQRRAAPLFPDYALRELAPCVTSLVGPPGEKVAHLLALDHAPRFRPGRSDWQDTLRRYYLTAGVLAASRAGRCIAVRYVDGSGVERSLNRALDAPGDALRRLILRWDNGLEIRVNQSSHPWRVRHGATTYELPEQGFLAATPAGLLAVSGVHRETGTRFDFARNPGHSLLLDGHGRALAWDGFPTDWSLSEEARRHLVVHDQRTGHLITAHGSRTTVRPAGPPPKLERLTIDAGNLPLALSLARPACGLRALAHDANGHAHDVSTLVAWSSQTPQIVGVDAFGIARVRAPGTGRVRAALGSLVADAQLEVTANPAIGQIHFVATSHRRALVTYATDVRVPDPVLNVRRRGCEFWRPIHGWSDPAGKTHTFVVYGLEPGSAYELRKVAKSQIGLMTTEPAERVLETAR